MILHMQLGRKHYLSKWFEPIRVFELASDETCVQSIYRDHSPLCGVLITTYNQNQNQKIILVGPYTLIDAHVVQCTVTNTNLADVAPPNNTAAPLLDMVPFSTR